jgi:hypothetical protein
MPSWCGTWLKKITGTALLYFYFTVSRLALGPTQPPIQWVPRVLSSGVKQPGHEADHPPPSWLSTGTTLPLPSGF